MLASVLIILKQSVQRLAAMNLKNVCIILINMLIFANALSLYDRSFYPKINIWQPLRPGVLLHALDQVTVNEQHIDAPELLPSPLSILTATPSQLPLTGLATKIQRRVSSSAENRYSNEDHLNADHSNEYDYDKAYDQFVQHYFNSAKSDALNEDSASVESLESPYSRESEDYEEHSEPLSAASKKTAKEKCKKVHRNRQECVICKNLKNNEKSETCSYSTETEPQTYAYNEEKSYKKQKKSSEESEESTDSDEEKQPSETVAKSKKSKIKAARQGSSSKAAKSNTNQHKIKGFKKLKDTSSCIKKVHRHKICYNCYNPDGKQLVRCYSKSADGVGNRTRTEQQVQKSEKKIYKRMVSYSYAKGKVFDAVSSKEFTNTPDNSTNTGTSPRVKRNA